MRFPRPTDIPDLLSSRGLRCTRQRRALYEALCATKRHPTAEELYHEVRPRVEGVSLATVYNSLDAFCRANLAQKFAGSDGRARFDANVDTHPHLRCQRTGRLIDIPDDLAQRLHDSVPADLLAEIESALGCKVEHVHIELIGELRKDK